MEKNDVELVHLSIAWPLPSKNALEKVVKAISCNSAVAKLDISDSNCDWTPRPWNNIQPWWNGRKEIIYKKVKSAMVQNSSIKEVCLKKISEKHLNYFVDLAKHS